MSNLNIYDLETPALLVDIIRLERNIDQMAHIAKLGGKALRPHIKTHKSPDIARMQMNAGACGLTVAKLGEAEVFAEAGFNDLFVANLIVGAKKIERLLKLLSTAKVTVGVDSYDAAMDLSDAGKAAGVYIPVRMEVDSGLGRCGVRSVEQGIELGKRLAIAQGISFRGLFTHEGHLYKIPAAERPEACRKAVKMLTDISDGLRAEGVLLEDISVGSTPGAPIMAGIAGVTEIRPGAYSLQDSMQIGLGVAVPNDCALTVMTTVISRPDTNTAIIDGGTKTFSGDKAPDLRGYGLVTEDASIRFDWASEEHGHLDLSAAESKLQVGYKVRITPWHVCATVNMHEQMYAVRGEEVVAAWPVAARGKLL